MLYQIKEYGHIEEHFQFYLSVKEPFNFKLIYLGNRIHGSTTCFCSENPKHFTLIGRLI